MCGGRWVFVLLQVLHSFVFVWGKLLFLFVYVLFCLARVLWLASRFISLSKIHLKGSSTGGQKYKIVSLAPVP